MAALPQDLLKDYVITELLYTGKNSKVYRAQHTTTQQRCAIKIPLSSFPSKKLRNKYLREYRIGNTFKGINGVLQYVNFEPNCGHSFALIMEDIDATSLQHFMQKQKIRTVLALQISILILDALSVVAQSEIIHSCLSPSHILISQSSGSLQVKIIDFGFCTELRKDYIAPTCYIGKRDLDLPYISPERTGRMNRDADYRSDFYSLGCILYEMLTGSQPFSATDSLELVYSHIAKVPKPVSSVNPDVPALVSDIVQILLAKSADERYQSANGIKRDLELCLGAIKAGETPRFELRQHDSCPIFHVHQKLYGRSKEIASLLAAYEKVAEGSVTRSLFLVHGYSGIGKTALIHEIYKPLTRNKGYFVSGKFEQLKKIPYSAFIQAFQSLVKILLMEGEERMQYWRATLLKALGSRGQVIIDVVPSVELIIGPQPPLPPLTTNENENRFKQVFLAFIEVFASKEHPLVIFIDDLQWSDTATLKLIEAIMISSEIKHFFLIGTYRDNEVDPMHPLISCIHNIESQGQKKDNLALQPLEVSHVQEMLCDSLKLQKAEVIALADLIHSKTTGNPFFVIQLMNTLAADKIFKYNFTFGKWEFDMKKISSTSVTDNVIAILIQKIFKLPVETQKLLSYAAIIGNKFELGTLALVSEHTVEQVCGILFPAARESLIMHKEESAGWGDADPEVSLNFLHDKVQQAAYEVLEKEDRMKTHFKIAKLLLQQKPELKVDELLFTIVSHFRSSKQLIATQEDILTVLRLTIRASIKACECSAFQAAAEYATFGLELLPPNSWESMYDITFELYRQLCESEYLRKNYEQAEKLYSYVLQHAKTVSEKITINDIKTRQYEDQQRFLDAVNVIISSLALYGLHLPTEKRGIDAVIQEQQKLIKELVGNRKIMDIINDKEMTNTQDIQILKLLIHLWSPAYCTGNLDLSALASYMLATFSLTKGLCQLSSIAYLNFSYIVGDYTGDYKTTYEFGALAIELLKKYPNDAFKQRAYFTFYSGINNYLRPLRDSWPYLEQGIAIANEYGDLAYAAYNAHQVVTLKFFAGEELQQLMPQYQRNFTFLKKTNAFIYRVGWTTLIPYRFLLGIDFSKEESEILQLVDQNNEIVTRAAYYLGSIARAYWDRSNDLLNIAKKCKQTYISLAGNFHVLEAEFYVCLSYLACFGSVGEEEAAELREVIETVHTKFARLSVDNPESFAPKASLMAAEKLRISKAGIEDTIDMYEQAISQSQAYGYIHYAALSNELCARYWIQKGKEKYATPHIQAAFSLYDQWGAITKLKQLSQEFPQIVNTLQITNAKAQDTSDVVSMEVDVQSVLKMSQAVAHSEMNLEQFLQHIMKIIIENAGAQRGVFVLSEPNEKLLVVAESSLEGDSIKETIVQAVQLDFYPGIPKSIVHYVARVKNPIIVDDCLQNQQFSTDPYFFEENNRTKAILCIPIISVDSQFKGVIYLENNVVANAFSKGRISMIGLLGAQIALHLENSKFSALLESEKRYKALTSELQDTKKRLEEFIDVLCHELRNPMNGIVGNQTILQDILKSVESACNGEISHKQLSSILGTFKETIESITISSDHLKDIVDTVLTVSMLENKSVKIQSVPFRPQEVIPQVCSMFKAKLREKRLEIVTKTMLDDRILIGDPYRLKEILINLLSNAIKFTQDGTITLTTFVEQETDTFAVLKFEMEDTGIGMTLEEQSKLFRSFSQANNQTSIKYGGSGLGLKICKELVQLMDGDISLSSLKDKGTMFIFTIKCKKPKPEDLEHLTQSLIPKIENSASTTTTSTPSSSSSSSNSSTPSTPATPAPAKTLKILVAEDNSINLKVLVQMLKLEGHAATTATNGLEAYNEYVNSCSGTNASSYDAVLMDIQMPLMNGIDSTKKIREFEQQSKLSKIVPVVGVSANARDEHLKKAMDIGMNAYVTKPYRRQDIAAALAKVCK